MRCYDQKTSRHTFSSFGFYWIVPNGWKIHLMTVSWLGLPSMMLICQQLKRVSMISTLILRFKWNILVRWAGNYIDRNTERISTMHPFASLASWCWLTGIYSITPSDSDLKAFHARSYYILYCSSLETLTYPYSKFVLISCIDFTGN